MLKDYLTILPAHPRLSRNVRAATYIVIDRKGSAKSEESAATRSETVGRDTRTRDGHGHGVNGGAKERDAAARPA